MMAGELPTFAGVPVVVSRALPLPPSHREDATRIVRHGLADVLEWLGEPVGPAPGEPTTHAVAGTDPATGSLVLFVSQKRMHELRNGCAL